MAVIYLGYDLAKARLSPCDSIFRETAVGLSTRITFLKAEGELQIGHAALTELDERAQMTALNLKTCCTVLDAGRIDPEQFLQCKANTRAFEERVEEVVALVNRPSASVTTGTITKHPATPATATPASTAPPADIAKTTPAVATPEIKAKVEAAREASRAFNQQLVEVRREAALATLEATPARHVDVTAQEREPNDDVLNTNVVTLDTWVTGSIGAAKDADVFAFETPPTYRDWIRIELQNQSTTLEPHIQLFDAEKTSIGTVYKTTQGADAIYSFVAAPGTRYSVRISNHYGESTGVYLLRVHPSKAYDAFEPNDGILDARPIKLGDEIEAEIMDKADVDYFAFSSASSDRETRLRIENRSTSLHPSLMLYDADKTNIANRYNTTRGGEVSHTFKPQAGKTYYVRIADHYADGAGKYRLVVEQP